MKIGTPLSKGATRVMLLGCGELGKEVIIALQRLEVEVIGVDRYENAPSQQVAHRAYTIDMSNGEQLKALIEQERPHYVVPEIEAIATDTLAQLAEQGVTEVIPTPKAVQLTMNREGIRCLAAEILELPTSRYGFASSLNELQQVIDAGIGYPCIIKPVMSSSGKGQSTLHCPEDVEKAWHHAMSGGRVSHGRVIVESMVEFDFEITLLTVRAMNAEGELTTAYCEPIGHRQELGDYVESWQPQPMTERALQRSREVADKVTAALGGRGVFGVELFIKGDQVWFSEVSPRPHDTGMVTLASQWQNEFELHARAILGLPVDTTMACSAAASAVIYGELEGEGVSFEGVEEALAVANSELRLFGKPIAYQRRRMGVAVARANSITEARSQAKLVASKIHPVIE